MLTSRRFVTVFLFSALLLLTQAHAQTYSLLYAFSGLSDGGGPEGQLIEDASGNLFGTTNWGGDGHCRNPGCGVVFELDPSGVLTVLHTFTGKDGANPLGNMAYDGSDTLYGTTADGGDLMDCVNITKPVGCGVIFKLNKVTGQFTVLYRFAGGADGAGPNGLIRDAKGNLYGATSGGGMAGCGNYGTCGTIFKLDTTGKHTVLYTFTGGTDGGFPIAVVVDNAGNLYGTTNVGGDLNCNPNSGYGTGCGTLFELTAAGDFKVLHAFAGGKDGEEIASYATLLLDPAGNLYGTTPYGGNQDCSGVPGCGLIFKMNSAGKGTSLYSFSNQNIVNGENPYYGLTYDRSGNLYSTTTYGGNPLACSGGCGTVDRLDRTGALTVLYTFEDHGDGYYPTFLTSDSAGNLYGATVGGGGYDATGTIFKITP